MERLAIILESGTTDKLLAASILTAGAAAMGKEVRIFLTFGGLMAFRKGAQEGLLLPKEFAGQEEELARRMEAKRVPHWLKNFQDAKEIGEVHLYACDATMSLFDLKKEDLVPEVEDVVGVATFLNAAEGAQTLFI
jgi:peroxiredoxin family protein